MQTNYTICGLRRKAWKGRWKASTIYQVMNEVCAIPMTDCVRFVRLVENCLIVNWMKPWNA